MKERCRDGCRTFLLIAGVVLVPAIFHTSLPPCHPYITIHFMEMILSTCINIIHAGFVDIVVNRDISQRVHCFFLFHKSSSVSFP